MENQKKIQALKMEFRDILTECFDFSVMDGWADIIRSLLKEVKKRHPHVKVLQIKEKFGGLRFYTDIYDEKLYDIISLAEIKSRSICEFTGKPGKTYTVNNWVKTACEEMYKKATLNGSWIGAADYEYNPDDYSR